jgi:membrane dipeptidase
MKPPLIVDAHEDLAWNILALGRDYTRAAAETRRRERGTDNVVHNGETLLGWPDYQAGRVALVFATLFAAPQRRSPGDWDAQVYTTCDDARRIYRAQLETYHRLAEDHPACFRLVGSLADLQAVLEHWQGEADGHPVGLLMLMEGAEAVRRPAELEEWWQLGLRIIGPAWAGTRFCGGTREPGPLTGDGRALLAAMAEIGFLLDLSHMDEAAALEALDIYPGTILASHANAAARLPGYQGNRLLSDTVIRRLFARGGVIGVVPYAHFLKAGWTESQGRQAVPLSMLADQVDHLCQLAGDARHVGLGSDFDGGFGLASTPAGIDTIADLQKLATILSARGYHDEDIAAILGRNWLDLLRKDLPR